MSQPSTDRLRRRLVRASVSLGGVLEHLAESLQETFPDKPLAPPGHPVVLEQARLRLPVVTRVSKPSRFFDPPARVLVSFPTHGCPAAGRLTVTFRGALDSEAGSPAARPVETVNIDPENR